MGIAGYAVAIAITAITVQLVPFLLLTRPSNYYNGTYEKGFEGVENAFRLNFDYGWERHGAAFAVYHKGHLVVDLWGGFADTEANRHWKADTICVLMSLTKVVAALSAAVLVDRGFLDYDALVTDYWPEFGQNGKATVTVKMLLAHEAGLAWLDEVVTREIAMDWRKISQLIERQKPNWPPGSAAGYHALTFGWLVDNLVRRADPNKRSVGEFFDQEIAKPYDIDLFVGLPYAEFYRVARLHAPVLWQTIEKLTDTRFVKLLFNLYWQGHRNTHLRRVMEGYPSWLYDHEGKYLTANDPHILHLELPSGNGVGSARALAKLFSLVLSGQIIKNQTIVKQMNTPYHFEAITPSAYIEGMLNETGYGFIHTRNPQGSYVFGHTGYGGQLLKVDPSRQLVFVYLTNGLGPTVGDLCLRCRMLEDAVYASLDHLV